MTDATRGHEPGQLAVEIEVDTGAIRSLVDRCCQTDCPDLIALGTHARRGVARAILGSVAADLLARAPTDVLVTR